MYVRYSGRHLFFLFRHVLLFMEGEGGFPPTPASRSTLPHDATQNSWFASCGNIKSPTYTARPNKTCDVLLYTILFLDVSSIDHVLMGRRKEKIKDEGRRRVECLDENSFFFSLTGENLVNNFSVYFRKRYINIFQSGWSFSISLFCSRSTWDRH